MSEERDPLDDLFADDEPAAGAGEDTQTGADTQTATGDDTKTDQEAPGTDSVEGGNADDKADATGNVKMVPLAALEEARQRARDAEARLSAQGEDTISATDAGFVPIDPKEDPAGAYDQMMSVIQLNAVNTTLNFSEKSARKEHGSEYVDKVFKWATERFETDPEFATRILTDSDPYELAIADYKKMERDAKISNIDPAILEGLDEDEAELIRAHRASKAPKGGEDDAGSTGDQQTQPRDDKGQFAQPPRRKVDAPPRSIADAPSGGSKTGQQTIAAGEGVAFDEVFK